MWGVFKFLELIKFSHTIFALPFALIGAILAFSKIEAKGAWTDYGIVLFWVVLAMGGARTGAMGFNRLVDRHFDLKNPRTQNRPSVTGVSRLRSRHARGMASGMPRRTVRRRCAATSAIRP